MQADAIGSQSRAGARLGARSQEMVGAAMAALIGAFLIWGVGFSPIAALHNAAHDTRHSLEFPCH
jgi:cobalt transporter subunit CbtB